MIDAFNFEPFEETIHMFKWLHPDPTEAIKTAFQENLNSQVSGSVLTKLHIVNSPQWLSGGIRQEDDEDKVILVRAGVAFSFILNVQDASDVVHELTGVYSWVAVNMNKNEETKQRTWFDLNGTLEEFGSKGILATRVYFETNEDEQ
jgi:hypothetical protein